MVSTRRYNRRFKLSVCAAIVSGSASKAQTCREHGLTPSMLDRWVAQYRKLGAEAFPNSLGPGELSQDRKVRELEALVGRLTLENQILRSVLEKGAVLSREPDEA